MRILYILLALAMLSSCTKKTITAPPTVPDSVYNDRLEFALEDNFSFSYYFFALKLEGMADTLSTTGPFTVIAPENAGFNNSKWNFYGTISFYNQNSWPATYVRDFVHYSILNGRYSLDSLPFGINQQLPVSGGYHIYVSKYVQGEDTVVTVNGCPVAGIDVPSSNGLTQALTGPINPEQAHSIIDYIRNDPTLSIFAAALQRVHADTPLLAGAGPFTVIAPSNDAFAQTAHLGKGLSTMDSILAADTSILGPVVRNHILSGRYFLNDLIRADSNSTDTLQLPTFNNEPLFFFQYTGYPAGPAFLGGSESGQQALINNGSYSEQPYMGDIPAGNGVIQKVHAVLVP